MVTRTPKHSAAPLVSVCATDITLLVAALFVQLTSFLQAQDELADFSKFDPFVNLALSLCLLSGNGANDR